MKEIPFITEGLDFTYRIKAQRLGFNKYVNVSFEEISGLAVNHISLPSTKTPVSYSIDEYGRLIIPISGEGLACNTYGLELTGFYNNGNWRRQEVPTVEIVKASYQDNYALQESDDRTIDITITLGETTVSSRVFEKAIEEVQKKIVNSEGVGDVKIEGRTIVEINPTTGKKEVNLQKDMLGKVDDVRVNGDSILDENNVANIEVPTTVEELNDSSDYAKKTDLQTMQDEVESQIPGKVSDLQNDSQFQTASEVDAKVAAAAVNEVSVSLEENGGSAAVERSYADGQLTLAFKNLKGAKGDALTWDDLTPEQKASLQGKQGDSAVFDPQTGNILATLHSGIGSDNTNSMTQNGITREVLPIKDAPAMRVPGKVTGYLTNSGKVNSSSNFMVTDYVMLEEGQTKIHIVSGVWKPNSYSQVCFYSEPDEEHFVDKINEGTANTECTNKDYDIPPTAKYCRFTVKPDVDGIITVKGSLIKRIEDIEGNNASMASEVAEVRQTQAENSETLNKVVDMFDINVMSTPCAEGKDGKLLTYNNTTGVHGEATVSNKGITDFIPVTGGKSILLVSGFYVGTGYAYRLAEFYTEASTGSEIGVGLRPETTGAISNMRIAVPEGAAYMRLSLESKNTPGIIDMSVDFDVEVIKEDIEGLKADKHIIFGQIKNNPLPVKTTTEELNILLIGSSYGIDSIDALVDVGRAAGVKINTWNMYKSGGSVAQYLAQIESGSTEIVYYRNYDGTGGHYRKTVLQALNGKTWDVIVLMNSANDSYNIIEGVNEDFAKLVAYVKENCTNPRVVLALNSTWTSKARKAEQDKIYKVTCDLMRQTGIDVVIPNGAAIKKLQETFNDDVYRDAEHLNPGIGRFTTACTLYYATAFYIFGVPLTANMDITGYWGNPEISAESAIQVSSENRAICIECAKKANLNRFLL